jgi:transcriptional regulator with XRE-family HTH domain
MWNGRMRPWNRSGNCGTGVTTVDTNPPVPAKVFGKTVRAWRENAGLTQRELGRTVFVSDSLISEIETGDRPANPDLADLLEQTLNAHGGIDAVYPITLKGGYPSVYAEGLESDAVKIHDWESRMIPGLVQTPEYARAVIRAARPRDSDEKIENDVQSRITRQEIFNREVPPMMWFVFDESALYRPYGGKEVMHAQLIKLEKLGQLPNVRIQVMRFNATEHPGNEGPLRVMEFQNRTPVMYTEGWYSRRMTEDSEDISEAMTNFDLIRASAMSPAQSATYIAKVRQTRYE